MGLRPPARALLAAALALLAGCSTFERDWEAAAAAGPAADPVLGRWEGTWKSEASGHDGGLRAIISLKDGAVEARYRATYAGFLSFEYTVPLETVHEGEAARFQGKADLGWLAGGVYDYEGRAEGGSFRSTYRAKSDHGVFAMQRVEAK